MMNTSTGFQARPRGAPGRGEGVSKQYCWQFQTKFRTDFQHYSNHFVQNKGKFCSNFLETRPGPGWAL